MTTSYATIDDLGSAWQHLTADETSDVENALEEASILVRAIVRNRGGDITTADAADLRVVVARMVRRACPQDDGAAEGLPIGLESSQIGVGPFQRTFKFPSGGTGQVYLAKAEYELLGLNRARAFSLDLLPEGWR